MIKTAVITGATSGIGFETAKELLKRGFEVIHLARNEEKALRANDALAKASGNASISHLDYDLTDLQSVKVAAAQLKMKFRRIDVLINNAGGMFGKVERSKDGFEMHFALNHLGHFYLTTLLLPVLISSKCRVINVSSEAHRLGRLRLDKLERFKGFEATGFRGYGPAKACNILFSRELHRRYHEQGISAFAVHPGAVSTAFGHNLPGFMKSMVKLSQLFFISAEKGAKTSVFLATEPGIENKSGGYFKKCRLISPSKSASSYQNAVRLWDLSEEMIMDVMG